MGYLILQIDFKNFVIGIHAGRWNTSTILNVQKQKLFRNIINLLKGHSLAMLKSVIVQIEL